MTDSRNPNLSIVELIVNELGELADQLVLVGGCAVGMLITDTARPEVRVTRDVDMVTEAVSLASYYSLQDKIREHGFTPDMEVICRWRKDDLILDVMPAEEIGQGFTNQWYTAAIADAVVFKLSNGREVKVVSAPVFIATKLESFYGRGNGDYGHHDMEDIINIIDGRAELADELLNADANVRTFIVEEFEDLLADQAFAEHVPWHLHGDVVNQARAGLVLERMRKIAGL